MPVVLDIARESRPLLADEANRIQRSAIGITEQQRSERRSALVRVTNSGDAGIQIAEGGAAGNTLPSKAVVVAYLEHATQLQSVRALHPGEVVVESIDSIFAAIVGAAAPTAEVAKIKVQQVLFTVRNVPQAHFILPMNAALYGGLDGIVTLAPVIAPGVKVIQLGR